MNTQTNSASAQDDRPPIFFGMDHLEMSDLRQWLEEIVAGGNTTQLKDRADLYVSGVRFGLAQIGQCFSRLPGTAPLTHSWTDAMGTKWRWDEESFQPVADKAMNNLDTGDFADLSDDDFICFVRGLLDSTVACGWERPSV